MTAEDIIRLIIGLPIVLITLLLVLMQATGQANLTGIENFGLGVLVTLVVQFYYRKSRTEK